MHKIQIKQKASYPIVKMIMELIFGTKIFVALDYC